MKNYVLKYDFNNEAYIYVKEWDLVFNNQKVYADGVSDTDLEEYLKICRKLLDDGIEYFGRVIKDRTYDYKHISNVIFKKVIKTEIKVFDYLICCSILSRNYLTKLRSDITKSNILAYKNLLMNLIVDLEELMACIEVYVNKSAKNIRCRFGKRNYVDYHDILFAVCHLYDFEKITDINNIDFRNIKPIIMFEIRQLLELYFKKVLGYSKLTDSKGNISKKNTQIGLKFIVNEIKKPNSRIFVPFDIEIIVKINEWANGFVHTGNICPFYVLFFAVEMIKKFFTSEPKSYKIYDGTSPRRTWSGGIQIKDYETLKKDFETFVNEQSVKNPKIQKCKIEWIDIKDVVSYITSL